MENQLVKIKFSVQFLVSAKALLFLLLNLLTVTTITIIMLLRCFGGAASLLRRHARRTESPPRHCWGVM